MQEFREKVTALVEAYGQRLAVNGIMVAVSKKYFETDVAERSDTDVFTAVDRVLDRRREKKNGYHYTRNRYHSIVLSVLPTEKGAVRKEYCRDYAFLLKKVERAHLGLEPEKVIYAQNKVLKKIEALLLRILRKSEKTTADKLCKDTLLDAVRYTMTAKYGYKRRILGKDRSWWEMAFLLSFVGVAIALVGLAWLLGKLI